jgi:hypothetical protein
MMTQIRACRSSPRLLRRLDVEAVAVGDPAAATV